MLQLIKKVIKISMSDKGKYEYIDYGIELDWWSSGSLGNGFARNVITFGVDNS